MIQRVFFAFKMGWRYRQPLRIFQQQSDLQCHSILSLDLSRLKRSGIKILAIDFDGVLVSHGEEIPTFEILDWLRSCIEIFGQENIFILSNRPTVGRQRYFLEQLPDIQWVQAARKKPYPDGILQILDKTKALPASVLVIDDRLLTGILAALIAGTQARWVTQPFIAIRKRPVQESFFIFLRWAERFLLR